MAMNTSTCELLVYSYSASAACLPALSNSVSDFTSGLYGKTDAGLHDEIRSTLARGIQVRVDPPGGYLAMTDTLRVYIQLGAHTTRERDLAELLCTRFPSINAVRFTNSGTEATLLALMTAVRYTGRNKVLVFDGGYHGTGFSGFHADEDGILGADQLQSLPSLRTPFVRITGITAYISLTDAIPANRTFKWPSTMTCSLPKQR